VGSILVRGLDQKTIERLKARARLNGRTLQQEVKTLLERAAEALTMREARRLAERVESSTRRAVPVRQHGTDPRRSRFALTVAFE
jgi:hypothetical protein